MAMTDRWADKQKQIIGGQLPPCPPPPPPPVAPRLHDMYFSFCMTLWLIGCILIIDMYKSIYNIMIQYNVLDRNIRRSIDISVIIQCELKKKERRETQVWLKLISKNLQKVYQNWFQCMIA